MSYTYADIDAYLNGELPAESQQAFEQELGRNEQLQQQVSTYRLLQTTISKHQQAEASLPALKQLLEPLTQQHFRQQKARLFTLKRSLYTLAAVAAVVLILLLALPGVSPDGYRVDDMPGAVVRGYEDEKAKAAQLFNQKQYDKAVAAFTQLKKGGIEDATVDFYLGISLLKTGQYTEALPLFENLAQGVSVFAADANFFAALSAYHLQQNIKAKQYAQQVGENSRYWNNAKAILKKME